MMKLQVKDHPGLVRDPKSHAIVNVDEAAYNEYKNKKLLQSKVINMNEELNDLKKDVNEIKDLLKQILQRT